MEIDFETHPDRYKHWTLSVEGSIATLAMEVSPKEGLRSDYELKLNSYDLAVDIELNDAVQRLRFEHPRVAVVILESANQRAFCAGANIPMLAGASHDFKVNFCKFTNETRLAMEDASRHSHQKYFASIQGACAGGGYELALACDGIFLVDDANSTVSLPEVPRLGVLPGTGGLTRLVDKRKVRRDLADVFCTSVEGIRGQRALEWGLVDKLVPKSRFRETVREHARKLAGKLPTSDALRGIRLTPVTPQKTEEELRYRYVTLSFEGGGRSARLTITTPDNPQPRNASEIEEAGADQWALRSFREIDDALLRLRFQYPEVGLVWIETRGDLESLRRIEQALDKERKNWLAREIRLLQSRVLKRLDVTSRTFFAKIDRGSSYAGSLLELALAADRSYALEDAEQTVKVATTPMNGYAYPTWSGLTRLEARYVGREILKEEILSHRAPIPIKEACRLGLVTLAIDELDWEEEIRVAGEERTSLSPDALTGMEASLRFVGPETMETKIFGRLSAWQNWIFQRPNAVGEQGALTSYGKPHRPRFDWKRC